MKRSLALIILLFVILGFPNDSRTQSLVTIETISGVPCNNPDSVMIDTSRTSPTFGKMFGKGPFAIRFTCGSILPLDSVSADSVLIVPWTLIDTSYSSIRTVFSSIEATFGPFTLRKTYPNQSDTSFSLSSVFALYFDSLVRIDSALKDLELLPLTKIAWKGGPFAKSFIPNDLGLTPGSKINQIFLNGYADDNYFTCHGCGVPYHVPQEHQLGFEWGLYKMHCPMAWEITQGKPTVFIADADFFPETSMNVPDCIRSTGGFKKMIPSTDSHFGTNGYQFQGDGPPTNEISNDHGCFTMSLAISGSNNGYPLVGTAPGCSGVGLHYSSVGGEYNNEPVDLEDIDVDGSAFNGPGGKKLITPPDVGYQVIYPEQEIAGLIDKGSIVFAAGGNGLLNYGDGKGFAPWIPTDGTFIKTDPSDPSNDVGPITVGGTQDGREYNPYNITEDGETCGLSVCHWCPQDFWRGSESFIMNCGGGSENNYNFSAGLEKYNSDANPTNREAHKELAFMDLVAPGDNILYAIPTSGSDSNTNVGYGLGQGTSFATPLTAGVGALMKSVDKWLGVPLNTSVTPIVPMIGADVQRKAVAILTFTADKVPDGNLLQASPAAQNSFPSSPNDLYYNNTNNVQWYSSSPINGWQLDPLDAGKSWQYDYNTSTAFTNADPLNLKRSWAQRMGFGRVNAYRAVANTIPLKGPFSFASSETLTFTGLADSRTNENSQFLMHFGGWKDSLERTLPWINSGTPTSGLGGNIIPNQSPAWPHYNQGETKLYGTTGTPTVLTVPASCILACDGILWGDATSANAITTSGTGKILLTGYVQDVSVVSSTHGPVKMDDLIIYSSGTSGYSNVTINSGNGSTDSSEIYGLVQLQDNGLLNVNGYLTMQPGSEVEMEGNKNFEISSGGYVKMNASSSIVSTSKKVIIDNTATMEISGLLHVNINCLLQVKPGGLLVIDNGANLQLDQFLVDSGGTILCKPGGRLTLNKQKVNYCYGHFLFNGNSSNRCMLTAGVSLCGTVDQLAAVQVTGNPNSSTTVAQSSISMTFTDDSDVSVSSRDVVRAIPSGAAPATGAFDHDHFSVNSSFEGVVPTGGTLRWVTEMLAITNSKTILPPSFVPSTEYTVEVSNCNFFDEGPYEDRMVLGMDIWQMVMATVKNDTLYNIYKGVSSYGCPNLGYYDNTFGLDPSLVTAPIQQAIINDHCGVEYCGNVIDNCMSGGVTAESEMLGSLHDNNFSKDSTYCLVAAVSSVCDLRNNDFMYYGGYSPWTLGVNYGAWAAGEGSLVNLSPSSCHFGVNRLHASSTGGNYAYDLVRGTQRTQFRNMIGGELQVACGWNDFGPQSKFHVANLDPSVYPLDASYNYWKPVGRLRESGIFATGSPLTTSDFDSVGNEGCGCQLGTSPCSTPAFNRLRNELWFGMTSGDPELKLAFAEASATLLSDTNSVANRRSAGQDMMLSALLMDSAFYYVPEALADFKSVASSSTAQPKTRSAMWHQIGNLYEMMGYPDSAVFAYDTILASYHQYSDSIYAQWAIQRDTITFDSTGIGDSEMYAYTIRVQTDIIAMMDTVSVADSGGGPAGKSNGESENADLTMTIHPNPATNQARICVPDIPAGTPVTMIVVNSAGEIVSTLYDATPDAELGLCCTLDCSKLTDGVYFARLWNDILGQSVKLVINH